MRIWLIAVLVAVVAIGCIADTGESQTAQTSSENPLHWMVGTWRCQTGYHNVPQARTVAHNAEGIYTLTEDENRVVHGAYRELPRTAIPTADFDDSWTIGDQPVDSRGSVGAFYRVEHSNLSTVSAPGSLHGAIPNSTIVGFDDYKGALEFPDHVSVGWRGNDFALINPTTLSRNWLVQIAPGTFQLYMSMSCTAQ
jgi:hypothetical protein